MANETISNKGILSIIRKGLENLTSSDFIERRCNGAAITAGMVVGNRGGDLNDVDPSEDGDISFVGIVIEPSIPIDDYEIGDTIADNTLVKILKPTGGRCEVAVLVEADSGDLDDGDIAVIANTAGGISKFAYNVAGGTVQTETVAEKVGTFVDNVADVAETRVRNIRY